LLIAHTGLFPIFAQTLNQNQPTLNEKFQKGVEALRNEEFTEASRIFEELVRGGMVAPFLYHNLGIAYQRQRRHEEAIAQFRKALELDPSFAESRVLLGAGLLVVNRPKEAITELERAVRTMPENVAINQQLAQAYELHGTPFQVAAQYKRLSEMEPNNPEYAFKLGRAYTDIADWCYREMMKEDLNSARVYQALGQMYMIRQDWASAEGALKKAVEADPNLPDIHLTLASILIQQKKFEEALHLVEKELQIVPGNLGAQQLKTQLTAQLKNKPGN
jgi:superkiller protein 3